MPSAMIMPPTQRTADAHGMVTLVAVDRDEEAREAAWQQARALSRRDPEAAAALMAQLEAEAQGARAGDAPLPDVDEAPVRRYDALRFRARLLKYYRGALTWSELGRLHYLTAFALAREAAIMSEEEQAEIDRIKADGERGGGGSTANQEAAEAQLAAVLPRPRPYQPPE